MPEYVSMAVIDQTYHMFPDFIIYANDISGVVAIMSR